MRKFPPAVLALFLLAGCATARWANAPGEYRFKGGHFVLSIPEGWFVWQDPKATRVVITRDGLPLQQILAGRVAIKDSLPNTKRKFEPGMLPQETAEIVADSFASDKRLGNFRLLENVPATVAGQPGFRLTFRAKDEGGLREKHVIYGFLSGEWFYFLRFTAAERHYFDRDLAAFEQVVRSFRLIPGTG